MDQDTIKDLYIHELKDLYSAEKQLTRALQKMAKSATAEQLTDGFKAHLEQTKEHANRLEEILSSHKQSTRGKKCKGMEGLIAEGAEMIEEEPEGEVLDTALIGAAQRVEHYEMAGYQTAHTFAEALGDKQGANLLQKTLQEETQMANRLTQVAQTMLKEA